MQADEGDGPLYNTTPTPASLRGWTAPLLVDRHEGVHVGGSPEYVGVSLHAVHSDFSDGESAFKNGRDRFRNDLKFNTLRNMYIFCHVKEQLRFRNNLRLRTSRITLTVSGCNFNNLLYGLVDM